MRVQETIIYRLLMRNLSFDAYFLFLIFWATFGGKIGVATTRAPNGMGPPNPTAISKSCFRNFQVELCKVVETFEYQ